MSEDHEHERGMILCKVCDARLSAPRAQLVAQKQDALSDASPTERSLRRDASLGCGDSTKVNMAATPATQLLAERERKLAAGSAATPPGVQDE